MATARAYLLNRSAWERTQRAVREVEAVHGPRGAARPAPLADAPTAPHLGYVRITSLVTTDGRYPGRWYSLLVSDSSTTQQEVIWVREVQGGKLVVTDAAGNPVFYRGRVEGYAPDGTAVWSVLNHLGAAVIFVGPGLLVTETAVTNAAVTVLTLKLDSTGTPSAGFGPKIVYNIETSTTGTFVDAKTVTATLTTATAGTEVSQYLVTLVLAGSPVTVLTQTPVLTTIQGNTSTTNAAVNVLDIKVNSTGTPTTNFGLTVTNTVETATPGTFVVAKTDTVTLTTATAGAEASKVVTALVTAGASINVLTLEPLAVTLGGSTTACELRFLEPSAGGTSYAALKAPALSGNYTLTLPTALPSSSGFLRGDSGGALSFSDTGTPADGSSRVAEWVKVATKTFADFATAGTTNTITIKTLAAKQMALGSIIKHSASFGGGGITAYTISVDGVSGVLNPPFDVFQAPGDTIASQEAAELGTNGFRVEDFDSTANITATAESTTANLDQANAGSVEFWLLLCTLP